MNWLTTIINKLNNYDKVVTENNTLRKNNKELKNSNDSLKENDKLLTEQMALLIIENDNLRVKGKTKHDSLTVYHDYLKTIPKKSVRYNFGKGYKEVHTIFKDSLKDEAVIKSFIKDDLGFDGSEFKSADALVLSLSMAFSAKYPTVRYYASDKELYGKVEYWALAKQTIAKLHRGGKAYDCDDVMVLKYSMLYYLLKEFFPADLWRLRGFIVDLWSGGGHAILGWVKDGVNDFVPIETTFRDDSQRKIWANNYTLRNSMFYSIRYSFDKDGEYVKF